MLKSGDVVFNVSDTLCNNQSVLCYDIHLIKHELHEHLHGCMVFLLHIAKAHVHVAFRNTQPITHTTHTHPKNIVYCVVPAEVRPVSIVAHAVAVK